MPDSPADRSPERPTNATGLAALIAILVTGIILITIGGLTAAGLATATTALGALYLTWRSQL